MATKCASKCTTESPKFAVNVYSEIGKLKTVMLHRPGKEISNLAPDNLQRLLFDDTPDLEIAQKEHDLFANELKKAGVEVLYIEKLLADILKDKKLKTEILDQFLKESGILADYEPKARQFLEKLTPIALAQQLIGGITKYELGIKDDNKEPLVIDGMPNILFQRDPFASVGNGVSIHKMFWNTRIRETLLVDAVFKHHPRFANHINYWYERTNEHHIEGGDILVLNKNTVIIGCTERTEMDAIRTIAKNLIGSEGNTFERVIAVDLKVKSRAFMHLDTVFTNIDYDKFLAHPLIFENIDQFKITEITAKSETIIKKPLQEYLSELVGRKITIIKCGGEDPINQAREQWNDGTNVLTINPGEVIAYDRNRITVKLLKEKGIKVHIIQSSELSRGRGGPRCMSMPIWRENLKK